MKLLFVTLCVFFVAVHGERKMDSKTQKVIQECLAESDIKESDLKTLEIKDDPKIRCLMACIFEKEGVLKNGDINIDLLKKDFYTDFPEIETKKTSEMVDKCVNGANDLSDICEKTTFIGECLKMELEKLDIKMD